MGWGQMQAVLVINVPSICLWFIAASECFINSSFVVLDCPSSPLPVLRCRMSPATLSNLITSATAALLWLHTSKHFACSGLFLRVYCPHRITVSKVAVLTVFYVCILLTKEVLRSEIIASVFSLLSWCNTSSNKRCIVGLSFCSVISGLWCRPSVTQWSPSNETRVRHIAVLEGHADNRDCHSIWTSFIFFFFPPSFRNSTCHYFTPEEHRNLFTVWSFRSRKTQWCQIHPPPLTLPRFISHTCVCVTTNLD